MSMTINTIDCKKLGLIDSKMLWGCLKEWYVVVIQEATEAHATGIHMFAVGADVKGMYSEEEMLGINSDPDGPNYFQARSDSLLDITDNLITQICNGG